MKPRREQDVYIGDSRVHRNGSGGRGEIAERDGERYYKISGYHTMSSFLMSVVSGYDHWLFVSSSDPCRPVRARMRNTTTVITATGIDVLIVSPDISPR